MTLAELGFTYELGDYQSLIDVINAQITEDTFIKDTPEKISTILVDFLNYVQGNFETNFQVMADAFETYFNEQIINIKDEITSTLALDPDQLYNIQVQKALVADNALKFNDKTESEFIEFLISNFITTSTVNNAVNYNGYSVDEFLQMLRTDLVPDLAHNTTLFDGKDYDTVKTDIANSVAQEDLDLGVVQNKVETEWTSFKSHDSEALEGKSFTDLINTVIATKVNNAIEADTVGGYSYTEIVQTIDTVSNNNIAAFVNTNNQTFVDIVKNIPVNYAANAGSADNALKLGGLTDGEWRDLIQTTIVDMAADSEKLGGLTSDEWNNRILTAISNLQSDLLDGTLKVSNAVTADKLGTLDFADFDSYVVNLVEESGVTQTGTVENATKFDGYTLDSFKEEVIKKVKVNSSIEADNAYNSNNTTKFNNKLYEEVLQDFFDRISPYWIPNSSIDPNLIQTGIEIPSYISSGFSKRAGSDLFVEMDILPNSFKNYTINYIKSSDGFLDLISSINYYDFNDFNFLIKEYIYNQDNTIQKVNFYWNVNNEDGTTSVATFTHEYVYDPNQNILNVNNISDANI